MPKCQRGDRYHVPPWIVPFILDKDGDALLPHDDAARSRAAPPSSTSRSTAAGAGSSPATRSRSISARARCGGKGPSIREQHRPLRRSGRRRQDRLRGHRRRVCARRVMTRPTDPKRPRDAVVSAPFFLRGELVEGQDVTHRSRDLGVTFATPTDRPGPGGASADRGAAAAQRSARGDHRLPGRDRPADPRTRTTPSCRTASTAWRPRTSCREPWSRRRSSTRPPTSTSAS